MTHRVRFLIIFAIMFIVGLGTWFLSRMHAPQPALPTAAPSTTPVLSPSSLHSAPLPLPSTLPEIQELLLQKSKIGFIESTQAPKASVVGRGALSSDIASLILPGAEKLEIKPVVYADEKDGYALSYELAVSLQDAYRQFAGNVVPGGWTLLGGYRTELASQMELENGTWQVRVTQTKMSDERSRIAIKSIRK